MIYILIPVHNRLRYTIDCLHSIAKQNFSNYMAIVVDDGSTDGTYNVIKEEFPWVEILKGDGNLWWTGCINLGVEYVLSISQPETDYILLLNNDLIIKENYLQELTVCSLKHTKSIIGSLSVDIENGRVHYAGIRWNSYRALYRPRIELGGMLDEIQGKYEMLDSSLLPGRGTLIPLKCIQEIGTFDVERFPHYAADHDFSLRARKSGYNLIISTKAVVYSHVKDTALYSDKVRSFWKHIWLSFFSIKSPLNIRTRFRWAKKHADSPILVYFFIDFLRVSKSLLFPRRQL